MGTPAKPEGLALGELEPATRARLAVLLALDRAGITREEAGLLERRTEVRVVVAKRAGEAVKREWQRFEREHPQATRPATTTLSTGDPKAPLVIRQHPASQP